MNKQTQKNLLKLVRESYEKIADDFSETRKKYLWPELIKLTENIKDGDSVLDVGCGNGRLLEALKDKKIKYIGADSSEKLIEIAKSINSKFQIPNSKFIVADILELNKLAEINFNYVFSVAVLHHIPGKDLRVAALKQLKNKVADPSAGSGQGGKIILTVWNLWRQKKFRGLIFKFALLKLLKKNELDFGDILFDWKNSQGENLGKRYYHAFCKRELNNIIKKAGLKTEKIYKDKYNYYVIIKK